MNSYKNSLKTSLSFPFMEDITNPTISLLDLNTNLIKNCLSYCSFEDILSLSLVSKKLFSMTSEIGYRFKEACEKKFTFFYNKNYFLFNLVETKTNFNWKNLYILLNKIKNNYYSDIFNQKIIYEFQNLNKLIYDNLYQCNNVPSLRKKNKILESEINTVLQNNLFDFLYNEQELYDYYDNLRDNNKKFLPKSNNLPFKYFLENYDNLYLDIENNKSKMNSLKKIRWYLITDLFEHKDKKKEINIFKSSLMMMDNDSEDGESDDEFINENDIKKCYNEFIDMNNTNNNNNNIDIIENQKEIILTEQVMNNLLEKENNPLFYIIKLIYLSIWSFCKENIYYLYDTYQENNEKLLIEEYMKRFNNFVEASKVINSVCENINVSINYLYKEKFNDFPHFPKFSIFRLCLKIWYYESLSIFQNGDNSILFKIKEITLKLFENTLNNEISNIKTSDFVYNSNFNFNEKKNKLSLNNSICQLFQSDNIYSNAKNDSIFPFGSYYDEENDDFTILEKGLEIINDSLCNEYNINLLNLSNIDVNNLFDDVEKKIIKIIDKNIFACFDINVKQKSIMFKVVFNHILSIFDDYFFNNRIIPKIKKKIFDQVYQSLKQNLFNYIHDKFINQNNNKTQVLSNKIQLTESPNDSIITSTNTTKNSLYSSFNSNFDDCCCINEISDFLRNETNSELLEINNFINEINKTENIIDLLKKLSEWHSEKMNVFIKDDKKITKQLNKKEISTSYNYLQRKLLSFSSKVDWEFIKKVKIIENKHSELNGIYKNNSINKYNSFNDFSAMNDADNMKPFYSNEDIKMEEIKENDNMDVELNDLNNLGGFDLGQSVLNLNINNLGCSYFENELNQIQNDNNEDYDSYFGSDYFNKK